MSALQAEILSASFLQSRRLVGNTAGGANHRYTFSNWQSPGGAAEGFVFSGILKSRLDFV
jgi:hypothetical protein